MLRQLVDDLNDAETRAVAVLADDTEVRVMVTPAREEVEIRLSRGGVTTKTYVCAGPNCRRKAAMMLGRLMLLGRMPK